MRVSVIVAAFAFVAVVQARPAEACSCVHIEGCGAIRSTDVVFEATVESITPEPPPVPGQPHNRQVVRLTAIKALRGKPESIIFVSTGGMSCDYSGFKVGVRYVIHANVIAEGYLGVSICGLTRPIASAKDVLACLKRD